MKIISKKDTNFINKPDGTKINYYLFDEYELHYNEIAPKAAQEWHHHEKIWETIFIMQGSLIVKWKDGKNIKKRILRKGDVVEVEKTPHTFINHTNKLTKFLVVKQILSNKSKRKVFKTDKIIDE